MLGKLFTKFSKIAEFDLHPFYGYSSKFTADRFQNAEISGFLKSAIPKKSPECQSKSAKKLVKILLIRGVPRFGEKLPIE